MAKIINGKKLAEEIKDKIVKEITKLGGDRPSLAIILIGDREDSCLYVNLKEKESKKCGIDTHLYKCDKDIPEREIFDMIDCLNKDDSIDAILVQLPLPDGFDTDGIIRAIDPQKDVDRFHPDNLEVLFKTCDHEHVMPPVFGAVLEMLKSINCDLENKQACVIYNSEIFGKGLKKVLECKNAKVNIAHANDKNLEKTTQDADVLITAVGRSEFIKANMIKKDATIIDIGITRKKEKTLGDVDQESVKERVSFITPVPGGVGPMTIAMLFQNTLELYKNRKNNITR